MVVSSWFVVSTASRRFLSSAALQLGLLGHLLDLFLGEAGRALDGDLLVLAGAEVLGGDVQDAVGVDVEGDFDLRRAARRRRDAVEAEGAEGLVVAGHRALALEDDDLDGGLVVAVGGEGLGLLRGNGGVARDHRAWRRRPRS